VLVITGPTATGKTETAIELALRVGAEIVSADSMQVYRGMDIGTAKPTLEERRGVPHHLIDLLEPDQPFSVADFQHLARRHIRDICSRGRLPIIVGGTALYIRALVDEYYFPRAPADRALRRRLSAIADERGSTELHRMLSDLDPATALRVHPNDRKRLIRAIEVRLVTGTPRSAFPRSLEPEARYLLVGLDMPRGELHRRIDARVDSMIRKGFVREVEGLWAKGYAPTLPPMRSLGYREIGDYLQGLSTLGEAIRLLKRNTKRFSKRQMTWFRADRRINWVQVGNDRPREYVLEDISRLIEGKWSPS
jgi:tRNA dimethylallyltransferase